MIDSIKDIKDFYVLGLPIQTDIGYCHFIKVKEYPNYFHDLHLFSLSKDEMIYQFVKINENGELDNFINQIKKMTLFELSTSLPELRSAYFNVFTKVFQSEDVLGLIDEDNFYYYRNLIMRMNVLKEEKINPNPEIQKALERSKRVKARENGIITFADMVTSVVGFNGLSYKDINEFTIYQLHMTFYRIAKIKNYDYAVIAATVSSDAKIESWSKHIDLFEDEKHAYTYEQFRNVKKIIED